jgi:hypothetical protein
MLSLWGDKEFSNVRLRENATQTVVHVTRMVVSAPLHGTEIASAVRTMIKLKL